MWSNGVRGTHNHKDEWKSYRWYLTDRLWGRDVLANWSTHPDHYQCSPVLRRSQPGSAEPRSTALLTLDAPSQTQCNWTLKPDHIKQLTLLPSSRTNIPLIWTYLSRIQISELAAKFLSAENPPKNICTSCRNLSWTSAGKYLKGRHQWQLQISFWVTKMRNDILAFKL